MDFSLLILGGYDPTYSTSFFTIFRARHNGDGPAADFPRFPALAHASTHPTDEFLDPMYDTSFFMIFWAQHNGDGPAADFPRFPRSPAPAHT